MREEKLLLAAAYQSTIRLYSLASQSELATLSKLKAQITALSFDPFGKSLLIAASDGRIYQWNYYLELTTEREELDKMDKQRILESYVGHSALVSAVAFHPLGRLFFSGDWQGSIQAWQNYSADAHGGKYDKNLFADRFFLQKSVRMGAARGDNLGIDQLRVSADGQSLFVATQDGSLEFWQVRGFKKISVVKAHDGLVLSLELSPDGKHAASLGRDGKLKIWNFSLGLKERGEAAESVFDLKQEYEVSGAKRCTFFGPKKLAYIDMQGAVQLLEIQDAA